MREQNLTDPATSHDPLTPTAEGSFEDGVWRFKLYDNTIETDFGDIVIKQPEDAHPLTISSEVQSEAFLQYEKIDIRIKTGDVLVIVDGEELPDHEKLVREAIKCPACGNDDPTLIEINYPVVVTRRLHSITEGFLYVSDSIEYGEEWNDENEFLCRKCHHDWEVPQEVFQVLEWGEPCP